MVRIAPLDNQAVLHVDGKPFALVLKTDSGWKGGYIPSDGKRPRTVCGTTRVETINKCYSAARDTGYVYSTSWYPDGYYDNIDRVTP